MKFAFNFISDDAREALDKLGVRVTKNNTMWEVWTDEVDSVIDEYIDRNNAVPKEIKLQYAAQKTRIHKDKDSGYYYYLIKGKAFSMRKHIEVDYRFNPPTQNEVSIFEVVVPHHQESFVNWLKATPPNANPEEGGVLI